MECSITYTVSNGPKLDPSRFQSVMFLNCQYDTICQHKQLQQVENNYIMALG